MAGSLDGSPTLVLGAGDYEFIVIYPTAGEHVDVRLSSRTEFTAARVAAELRDIADQIDPGVP